MAHGSARFPTSIYRLSDDEGYLIVINVGGSEEIVDLSVFSALPGEMSVATAAPNSLYDVG